MLHSGTDPTERLKWNPFIPGGWHWYNGFWQFAKGWSWYINFVTGEKLLWRIEGWKYEENYKKFILKIRKGVKWQDGTPFTAHDYVFVFNLLRDNPTLVGADYINEWFESWEAKDDYTLVIKLKKPNGRIHYDFGVWGTIEKLLVPKHQWEGKDPETFSGWPPIGTGPYKFYKAYPELKMIVWKRWDDWWAKDVLGVKLPEPKYVVVRGSGGPDTDLAALINGEIDVTSPHVFSWTMITTAMLRNKNITYGYYQDTAATGFFMSCMKYPLNMTKFRWVISYLIDRKSIAKYWPQAPETWSSPYPWPAPSYEIIRATYSEIAMRAMSRVQADYGFTFEYNPEKAKRLLDELGFKDVDGDGWRELPNGTDFKIEVITPPPPAAHKIHADLLVAELKKVGIPAYETIATRAVWERRHKGYYDISVGGLCAGARFTGNLYHAFRDFQSKLVTPIGEYPKSYPGASFLPASTRYKNSTFDALVERLAVTPPDTPEEKKIIEELLYIYFRDIPFIPTCEPMYTCAYLTTYWTGWSTHDNMYTNPLLFTPFFMFQLLHLHKPKPAAPLTYVTVYAVKSIPAFTGVDGKEYGPYKPGDAMLIPKEDAERLISEGVASYAPPVPPELKEISSAVTRLGSDVKALSTDLKSLSTDISRAMGNVTSIVNTLQASISGLQSMVYASVGVSILVLIVAIITLIVSLRRRT